MSNDNEYDLPEEYNKNPNEPKYERRRMKDGEPLVLRVLPIPGESNRIGDYWGLHFGYDGQSTKDPTKNVFRPFLCIERKDKNKMVIVECPACTYANPRLEEAKVLGEARKKEIARVTAIAKEKNVPQKTLEDKISALYERDRPVTDFAKSHNVDRKFRIRTVDLKGKFVLLEISYKTSQLLRTKIEEAAQACYPGTDRKIIANGRKGLYFKFTRTGDRFSVVDTIEVYRDDQDQKVFHHASDEFLAKANEAFGTFQEMQDAVRLTEAQIAKLVELDKLGGGQADPVEVNKVWGSKVDPKTATQPTAKADTPVEDDPFATDAPAKTEAVSAPEPKVEKKADPKPEVKAPVAEEDPFGDEAKPPVTNKTPAASKAQETAAPLMSDAELDNIFGL